MSPISTELQALVTVNVDGRDLGVFDKRTGGDTTVASVKYRPGGMGPEKSYRALPTYSDLVVSRVLEPDRDWELIRWLQNVAGSVRAQVVEQPLDDAGNAWGTPVSWSGRLTNVKNGQVDSTSSTVRTWELDVAVETRS